MRLLRQAARRAPDPASGEMNAPAPGELPRVFVQSWVLLPIEAIHAEAMTAIERAVGPLTLAQRIDVERALWALVDECAAQPTDFEWEDADGTDKGVSPAP
jgi:hypothetical protein